MNNIYHFIFLGFSCYIIISCLLTIFAYNSISGLIALIFAFINTTCLFFLMELEFAALLILIVYIGAISVLFLFTVMLFNLKEIVRSKNTNLVLKSFISLLLFFIFIYVLVQFLFIFEKKLDFIIFLPIYDFLNYKNIIVYTFFDNQNEIINHISLVFAELQNISNNNFLYQTLIPNINNELFILGQVFYDLYFIYLILTGFILLIGMFGAIVLINNSKTFLQLQHSSKQVSTNFNKRVSLLS
jgi:NADH:ubiquinone oxidoreductase subunit 6 (subunit J)